MGSKNMKIACTSRALIVIVLTQGLARLHGQRLVLVAHQLFGGFVHADQWFIPRVFRRIDIQNFFHLCYEPRRVFLGDAPAFLPPRLQFIFLACCTVSGVDPHDDPFDHLRGQKPERPAASAPEPDHSRWRPSASACPSNPSATGNLAGRLTNNGCLGSFLIKAFTNTVNRIDMHAKHLGDLDAGQLTLKRGYGH